MPQVCSNFIDGEWVAAAGGNTFSSYNPATGEEIGQYSASGERDALAAIEAAAFASPTWAATTPGQRAALLYRAADLMERQGVERSDARLAVQLPRERVASPTKRAR